MTKEELAEEYVRNKADKGNFDLEQFGKAYFSESSLKQAFIAGYEAMKAYNEKLLDGDIKKHNKIAELKAQIEKLQKINNEQKENLKKVRVALIQERTANIMNYGKGGIEMFDSMFEILKGVSN